MADELGTPSNPAPGHLPGRPGPESAVIDNRTSLPDGVVQEFLMAHWVETAGLQFAQPSNFQMYAGGNSGNMLARTPFRSPGNAIDEIKLARQIVDTDDDIKGVMGAMMATAFGEGMENQHADERTLRLFNKVAKEMGLDNVWNEMYREWLIAGQVNTIQLFRRARLSFNPDGTGESINAQLQIPQVGILPAEDIRVLTNDVFGGGQLAYLPPDEALRNWLNRYFSDEISPAARDAMRRENPILAALFTEKVVVPFNDQDMFSTGMTVFVLNPRMVKRTTMPKGAAAYPRPLLTANFALLEAKRLLNIMDFALLQGGTNYIVVAKQGSDALPAKQPEIDNLVDQVRSASRSGVLVGDHRIDIEIITPKLEELLSPAKRKLIGRKLAMLLLRIPEQVTGDAGNEGVKSELEFAGRTISWDRHQLKRHIEGNVYEETADRNPSTFTKGPPSVWFPRIILSGIKDFLTQIQSARDRGDIPRKYAVEALGFDYEAGVAQRKREKANGDDDVLTPGNVPFDSPQGPQLNNPGRPPGASPSNGRPGGAPPNPPGTPTMRPREPVRAEWVEERGEVLRVGELTAAILEQHPDHSVGRITEFEREAVNSSQTIQRGPVAVVPVNMVEEVDELRAIRLSDGLGMIVGRRTSDGALLAKALSFREPHWTALAAEEITLRWGFDTPAAVEEETAAAAALAPAPPLDVTALVTAMTQSMTEVLKNAPVPNITIQMPGEGDVEFVRGENGEITGKRRVPAE